MSFTTTLDKTLKSIFETACGAAAVANCEPAGDAVLSAGVNYENAKAKVSALFGKK